MAFKESFTVKATAPFDFDLTVQIFRSDDKEIRTNAGGKFNQVLHLNNKLALVTLTSAGTVEQPRIGVELKSNQPISAEDKQVTEKAIKFIFNLDFSLCTFYQDIKIDSTMSKIAQQLYGLKNPTTATVFEALVDSIVEQQISIKVAHTIERRIIKSFGEKLVVDGEAFFAYPSPQNIANHSLSDVKGCGLSQRKAEYIWGVAKLIADGKLNLEGMKNQDDPQKIISELDEIRGIGVWTAELTMLRGMQHLDALPADDFGIRRVISRYYCGGRPIDAADAREIAKVWGTWKGLAAFYLIIAEVKDIEVNDPIWDITYLLTFFIRKKSKAPSYPVRRFFIKLMLKTKKNTVTTIIHVKLTKIRRAGLNPRIGCRCPETRSRTTFTT
jgi:DNA-3-methyladenine glycosylase II